MNKEEFITYCKKINIEITDTTYNKFNLYYELLSSWNEKFNLTSIIEKKEVFLKHFYDSLLLSYYINFKQDSLVCDLGSGAGFPGIPLAIIFENIKFILVESSNKKCNFLLETIKQLDLSNVKVVNERAEIYARTNREKFDIVTCRALSHLSVVSELALPLLKIDGLFVPLKAKIEEELKDSLKQINKLGGIYKKTISYFLPIEKSTRNIVYIEKKTTTNTLFPREYNQIVKNNLKNKKK